MTAVEPAPARTAVAPAVPEYLDRPSFAELYAERYAPMVRLAHLLTGSNAVAEELVQDAFVRVYRRYERVDHPVPYLRQSVVNACHSHRRSLIRELRRRPAPGPETVEAGIDELRDALAALSTRQRAAVVLRYYEDLAEADIAHLLGCRPGTVKSLLARGLARLKEVLP